MQRHLFEKLLRWLKLILLSASGVILLIWAVMLLLLGWERSINIIRDPGGTLHDEIAIARWFRTPGIRIQERDWDALPFAVLDAHAEAGFPGQCGGEYLIANGVPHQNEHFWLDGTDRYREVDSLFVWKEIE